MIEKKDGVLCTPDAESLAQTFQHLEVATLQAQAQVRSTFARLVDALHAREKQLLRQIDVAHTQQLARIQSALENTPSENVSHVTVQFDQETSTLEAVSSLGTVGLTAGSLVVVNGDGSFLQRVEDYQDASQDHMSMFKPVPSDSPSPIQETVIRFSHITLPPITSKPVLDSPLRNEIHEDTKQESLLDETSQANNEAKSPQKKQHPTQVQQWLKQLSAETETEPSIGEPKHFDPL